MGNCFSDPSKPSKTGGQVLGSGPASTTTTSGGPQRPAAGSNTASSAGAAGRPLGGGGASEAGRERERALAAAEERAKAVSPSQACRGPAPAAGARENASARGGGDRGKMAEVEQASNKGVNASNPRAGKLSSKLQEERRTPRSPEPQANDNRMMDKGAWN